MTRRLRWSREALDDLKAQVAFIAADNPDGARRVADAIGAAAEGLAEMPTGRPGRVAGTYEKSVSRLSYVIAYALAERGGEEIVAIVRVIHTARDWPGGGWPQ